MPVLTEPVALFSPPEIAVPRKIWRYEDYLALPDDGKRYEIIEGELYVSNAPGYNHQSAVMEIARQMSNFVIERRLGKVLMAPFEVHLSEATRPVQPDILFIRQDRLPAKDAKFFDGAPDLVVEVLSPGSVRLDRSIKFSAYEKAGVSEYWIVNPRQKSVEVYTLKGAEYELHGEFCADETVTSALLPGLGVPLAQIFGSN